LVEEGAFPGSIFAQLTSEKFRIFITVLPDISFHFFHQGISSWTLSEAAARHSH
jgi:hypothetical protein